MAWNSLNLDELCKKLTGDDLSKVAEIPLSGDVEADISAVLKKKILSTEGDIADYAKYLTLKYSDNNRSVDKELVEKIFVRIILSKMKKENYMM
ncbi:MAG: hypothetical protein O8C66_07620 [Candidatus Methanoperedens sp.]|nr:hypothetical protein [Candidatus Methanoperedens sp.]MCZ7370363.1 hypothetical protein [Candidatus Methanoperedens sp.]